MVTIDPSLIVSAAAAVVVTVAAALLSESAPGLGVLGLTVLIDRRMRTLSPRRSEDGALEGVTGAIGDPKSAILIEIICNCGLHIIHYVSNSKMLRHNLYFA